MLDAIFSLDTIWWTLMVVYVPACIGLIGIVLLQQGKGGGFGGALGGGSGPGADTVFGTKNSQSLPVKITYAGATLFMTIAIVLSVLSGRLDKGVAPDLLEVREGDPTASFGSSALDAHGLGSALINEDSHNEVPVPAPAPTPADATIEFQEPVTDASTESAPADDSSDATE
jgi:preprotein translocase subunit SecG